MQCNTKKYHFWSIPFRDISVHLIHLLMRQLNTHQLHTKPFRILNAMILSTAREARQGTSQLYKLGNNSFSIVQKETEINQDRNSNSSDPIDDDYLLFLLEFRTNKEHVPAI